MIPEVVPPARLELAASRSGAVRSLPLSYGGEYFYFSNASCDQSKR